MIHLVWKLVTIPTTTTTIPSTAKTATILAWKFYSIPATAETTTTIPSTAKTARILAWKSPIGTTKRNQSASSHRLNNKQETLPTPTHTQPPTKQPPINHHHHRHPPMYNYQPRYDAARSTVAPKHASP